MIGTMLLWFSLSLGMQQGITTVDNNQFVHAPMYLEIETHAENNNFDIYAIYKNELTAIDLLHYIPSQDYYKVGATAKYKNFALNIEHECVHPTMWYKNQQKKELYGGHTSVSVTLSSKKD